MNRGPPRRDFEDLARRLSDEDHTWTSRLTKTAHRRALASVAALSAFMFSLVIARRADFWTYPAERMAISLATLIVLAGVLIYRSTHPAPGNDGRTSSWAFRAWLSVFAVTLVMSLLPLEGYAPDELLFGRVVLRNDWVWRYGLPCLGYGVASALPLAVLVWWFDGQSDPRTTMMGFSAAAAVSFASLHAHCADPRRTHLLFGHFSGGLVLWLFAVLLAVRARRRFAFALH